MTLPSSLMAKHTQPAREGLQCCSQQEQVPSQSAGRQQGCHRVFWVESCRELLKCFVLMPLMIFLPPLRRFWNSLYC